MNFYNDLEWIHNCILRDKYYLSMHGDDARKDDNLLISEIEEAILNGRIIEDYEDTGRGKSCLIAGFTDSGKPIHIVCGKRGNQMVVVTVYIPKPPKFKTIYQRG